MAVAVTVTPAAPRVGDKVVVAVTGFTSAGTGKITMQHEEQGGFNNIKATFTATLTTWTSDGVLDVVLGAMGYFDVTVHDDTANTDTTKRVEVFSE